jgi:hypothetical protein
MINAPIALFVYNRPVHTFKTLKALEACDLAKTSNLYIFCDGPKDMANDKSIDLLKNVNEICKKNYDFNTIKIIINEINLGLSKSIINGVESVLEKHDRVIVLEDDIVVSKGFLRYMNDALNLYEHEPKVGCIHGWNYPLNSKNINQDTFFLYGADCWGWATWKRAWNKFEGNGNLLLNKIIESNKQFEFNRRNTIDFVQMLQDQINGNNDSWAIRWHASLFNENMYCLHPVKSMVINIGLDSTGSNFGSSTINQKLNSRIDVKNIKIEDSEWFHKEFKYKKSNDFFKQSYYTLCKRKIKEYIYKLINQ